jgi:rhodanese-related sulfurtransferase
MDQYLQFAANHPFLTAAAAILIGIIVAYEFNRATRGFRDVDPADATRLINQHDALVIDVRASVDFDKSHLLHAVNVPQGELADRAAGLVDGERPVLVYCGTGVASGRAAAQLVRAGIKRVYNLKGGLSAWEGAGLPVARGRKGPKQ